MAKTAKTALPMGARAVAAGIYGNEWPYGPNVDHQSRLALLEWAEVHGVRYAPRAACLHWIAATRCAVGMCSANHATYEWMDHVSGWTRNGLPAVLVCQPYHVLTDHVHQLATVASECGLEAQIDGTGWYGRGTVFIQLWAPRGL